MTEISNLIMHPIEQEVAVVPVAVSLAAVEVVPVPVPVFIDFVKERADGKLINMMIVKDILSSGKLVDGLSTKAIGNMGINLEALKRVEFGLSKTRGQIGDKCKTDDDFATVVAMNIVKEGSRQGTAVETQQIAACASTSIQFGIIIENLSTTACRPTDAGTIATPKIMKEQKIDKMDTSKSFDFKVSGKIIGLGVAKVVLGSGGHQDNVFRELHEYCEWFKKFGNKTEKLFVLCDTDLIKKLAKVQEKYKDETNIIIGSHTTIQQYFITNYTAL